MSQSSSEIKYLVFDVESVADGELVSTTRYPGQDLAPEEALRKFRFELLAETGRDFIPYTYHVPVAVVIGKVRENFSLAEIVSLDEPLHRPSVITKHFWVGWEKYAKPTFITFNGRSFDIPLMELSAYRYGVSIPGWFNIHAKAYDQHRNRYNIESHMDLHEILTNFGSTWFRGGLNVAAQLAGKPGKIDVQGNTLLRPGELIAVGGVGRTRSAARPVWKLVARVCAARIAAPVAVVVPVSPGRSTAIRPAKARFASGVTVSMPRAMRRRVRASTSGRNGSIRSSASAKGLPRLA